MKVERMIKELKKFNPNAEVKLHEAGGNNVLFVLAYENEPDVVFIRDKSDSYLRDELEARFDMASDNGTEELDFFMDLLELGFTLDDIRENLPEKYEYSKTFCEEHGLV